MSKSSVLSKAVRIDPEVEDRQTAARISDAGLAGGSGPTSIRFPNGTVVPLSASLLKVLQASAEELADGHAVTVMSSEVALTPAEAADLLGLSRPFVVRLLDDGSIPSQLLPQSRHRKVLLSDVIAFQEHRARKRAGRQRIMEIVEENDLPY
jgi:excisionase family DNA binding protein